MKPHLIALILTAAFTGHALSQTRPASTAEWQRQQIQQREIERQRQDLEQQRQALVLLQHQQRRAERAARDASPLPTHPTLRPVPPPQPRRFVPTPQDRAYIDRYVQTIMRDPRLSEEAKTRLVRQVLDAVE